MSQLVKLAAVPLSSQYLTSATCWVGLCGREGWKQCILWWHWKEMLQSKDYQDPSILRLTLGRNYAKIKITRIHPSLDPSSQSTTKAQTRAPPDINDALNMNMIAIRIFFFINIVTKNHNVDLPWALVRLHWQGVWEIQIDHCCTPKDIQHFV